MRYLLLVFVSFSVLVSCEYDYPEPIIIPPTNNPVSFATDIQPIFNADCISSCHPGVHALDLTSANAYNQLWTSGLIDTVNAESSVLYQKINTGSMSTYISTPSDKTLILNWIKQGAKNN